ncbi:MULTISPECIES: hypothetical protein [unclassified Ensifer]|uniref:hypothetical protein n=1 Tax=unclassified Ensifer TaxID=2633371 RepID=UPI0008135E99|nr:MULTISPECIES: hypothetical protein [unclassified Ensifer]OCP07179.1 hypothetical protein BBX50_22700 [Ensifer sp. LC11]OCP07762.1 hypothetical protein BC374_22915 [Ensifer sp. LC13]OCP12076.1 hypothetical protein BC362_06365 [Ensifer sp. LC14]OCP31786.1 hypothetical protein BC364_21785 [Ensifer sp. LC499]
MSRWLLAAGILSLATTGTHLFAGGPEVHVPLLASSPSPLLQIYVSLLWHATSAVLLINSLALLFAAVDRRYRVPLAGAVILQYLAYAALFFGYGLAYLGSLWSTPQWVAFILMAGFAAIGARAGAKPLSNVSA